MAKNSKKLPVVDEANVEAAASAVLRTQPQELSKIRDVDAFLKALGRGLRDYNVASGMSKEWSSEFAKQVRRRIEFRIEDARRGVRREN